ncbi:MAG TPA: hypothetical protein VGM59_14375 [Dongiaceae bacterium]|jgi:hypothetical protein
MGEAVTVGPRRAIWLLMLGVSAGLAGCGGAPVKSLPCPQVEILPGANYLTRFAGDSEDLTDTEFEAQLSIANQLCHYKIDNDTQKTTINSDLSVQIAASRGPKNQGNKADIKYFVALTGPGGSKLMREDFGVEIPLTATNPTAAVVDEPTVQIPLKKNENGDYYRIYIYFDVTPKELAYNRRNPKQ